MALLPILHYPDPLLRNRAEPVEKVTDEIRRLADDMLETMYAAPGIGLAAIQVNVPLRVITLDVSDEKNEPVALINPEVVERLGEIETEEGCLSVPGVYDTVSRAERVRVRALGRDGETLDFEADDLLAICIQHEIDHLDGLLFVDHLSRLKQQRIKKRALKAQRQAL